MITGEKKEIICTEKQGQQCPSKLVSLNVALGGKRKGTDNFYILITQQGSYCIVIVQLEERYVEIFLMFFHI